MKKLLFILVTIAFSTTSFALEFTKGATAPDIHPRLLRKLVAQGIDNFEGAPIVYASGIKIPANIQKKWDEKKLSGGSVPTEGAASASNIFITKF